MKIITYILVCVIIALRLRTLTNLKSMPEKIAMALGITALMVLFGFAAMSEQFLDGRYYEYAQVAAGTMVLFAVLILGGWAIHGYARENSFKDFRNQLWRPTKLALIYIFLPALIITTIMMIAAWIIGTR